MTELVPEPGMQGGGGGFDRLGSSMFGASAVSLDEF